MFSDLGVEAIPEKIKAWPQVGTEKRPVPGTDSTSQAAPFTLTELVFQGGIETLWPFTQQRFQVAHHRQGVVKGRARSKAKLKGKLSHLTLPTDTYRQGGRNFSMRFVLRKP
ncbi:hypothetical protein D9M68_664280 [compost metagenome]